MPDLVGRELPHARERHLHRVGVLRDLGQVFDVRSGREVAALPIRRVGSVGRQQAEGPRAVGRQDSAREWGPQPLTHEVVLAEPEATEVHDPADDLARPWVHDRIPVRVAARSPVRPMDHVVADVLGIDALRQHLDPKRVDETGRFEGLRPPARALDEGATDRLGGSRIHVVDDRLDRLAGPRPRIALL